MLLWPFNKYPGTDYETFNWEWILKTVKEWVATMQSFKNDITAAWNAMQQAWTDYQDNLNDDWQYYQDDLNDQWQEFIDDTYKDQITEILEQHPEWVTTVMDGAITEPKINAAFLEKIKNVYITPDDFEGATDTIKLQAALNSLSETGGIIVINRTYTLNDDITINHDSDLNNRIWVIGLGSQSIIDFQSNAFKGVNTTKRTWGGLVFKNVTLTGSETGFYTDHLIRLYFEDCMVKGFTNLFQAVTGTVEGAQTIYMINNVIRSCKSIFDYDSNLYDIRVNNNTIEWCENLLHTTAIMFGCTFCDNCIEGVTVNPAFYLSGAILGCHIDNNYFEDCSGGYIVLDNVRDTQDLFSTIGISGNSFFGRNDGKKFIEIIGKWYYGSLLIENNNTSMTNDYLIFINGDNNLRHVVCVANSGTIYDPNNRLPINQTTVVDELPNIVTQTGTPSSPVKIPTTSSYASGIILGAVQGSGSGVAVFSRGSGGVINITDIGGVSLSGALTATFDQADNSIAFQSDSTSYDLTIMYKYLG